jgi:hypothetical protein
MIICHILLAFIVKTHCKYLLQNIAINLCEIGLILMIMSYIFYASSYVEYVCEMVADVPALPHNRALMLVAITMAPVPCFNKMKYVPPFLTDVR